MKEKIVKKDVLEGPVGKTLLKMSLSMMIGFLAGAAFNVTDTFYVSKLGKEALAAMGYTFPIVIIAFCVFMGIGVGASAVISRAIGQGDVAHIQKLTVHTLLLGLLVIFIFTILGYIFLDDLLRILGATGSAFEMAHKYMIIWIAGISFVVIPILGNNAIRATGDTLTPSFIMAFDIGLNIILDPIFIFGFGPIPAMGIEGAAFATLISRMLAVPVSLSILAYRKKMLTLHAFQIKSILNSWKKILFIGIPASGTNLLFPVSIGVITKLVSNCGIANVAAYSAGSKIENLMVIPIVALGASLIPFIGQNYGANNFARIKKCLKISYLYCIIWGVFCTILILSLSSQIPKIFTKDDDVFAAMITFLCVMPFCFGLRGVCGVSANSLNAIHRPIQSSIINIMRLIIVQIPIVLLFYTLYDFKGILIGIVLSELITATISIFWLKNVCNRLVAIQ